MAKRKDGAEGKFTDEVEARLCGNAFSAMETKQLKEDELKRIIQSTIKDDEAAPDWERCSWVIKNYKKSQLQNKGMNMLEIIDEGHSEIKWASSSEQNKPNIIKCWKQWSEEWGFRTSIQ